MATMQTSSHSRSIVRQPGKFVKAQIVAAGLPLWRLARASSMASSTLSCYLSGRTRNIHGQIAIARAFRRLSGQRIPTAEFWGDLWAEAEMRGDDAA